MSGSRIAYDRVDGSCIAYDRVDGSDLALGKDTLVNVEPLSRRAQMEEFMFLGLRMTEGVSRKAFHRAFGVELEGVYGDVIRRLCGQGLLAQQAGYVFLTGEGISVSNYVMSEFLK